MKKRIKIFAAFDIDVEEDVVRFGDFLCGLNAQCAEGEFFVFKSEKELCESLERPKEQIDAELDACEYFLLILGGKNDEFALDKLNRAIERYAKTHGNPDVHIFVNAANKNADSVINFFASERYEHYVEQYKHHDTLKAKFLIWLSAKQKDFAYEVDKDIHGTPVIKVGGVPISGLLDFDALLNNEEYKGERKQSEYDQQVKKTDIFIALFRSKAGKYTLEEVDVATAAHAQNQRPQELYCFIQDWQEKREFNPEELKTNLSANYVTDSFTDIKDLKRKLIKILSPRLCACGVSITETDKFIQIGYVNILRKQGGFYVQT